MRRTGIRTITIAVDWDDTLVDGRTQEWLPGRLEWIRDRQRRGDTVIIHSSRANYPEGLWALRLVLARAGLQVEVAGKPAADLYVDDRGVGFDWELRDRWADQARVRKGRKRPAGIETCKGPRAAGLGTA